SASSASGVPDATPGGAFTKDSHSPRSAVIRKYRSISAAVNSSVTTAGSHLVSNSLQEASCRAGPRWRPRRAGTNLGLLYDVVGRARFDEHFGPDGVASGRNPIGSEEGRHGLGATG